MKTIVSSDSRLILNHIMFTPHLIFAGQICFSFLHTHFKEPDSWKVQTSLPPALSLQDSDVLSLGVSSHRSWWKDNGPGCQSDGLPAAGWRKQQNPELTTVVSCWLEYQYIEILHCIVQLLVSVSLCHTLLKLVD